MTKTVDPHSLVPLDLAARQVLQAVYPQENALSGTAAVPYVKKVKADDGPASHHLAL